ncbi:hypothetical protein BDV93DRAFT_543713 [Ceratobasidium sp. AG-I]|nr:hypothetical protein BDV93DRAFT_543713 [Ceratobasidium sp. AG-I]
MHSPATLTRTEFNRACLGFLETAAREDVNVDEKYTRAFKGWSWIEHKSVPGWGYLARTAFSTTHSRPEVQDRENEALDDEELVEPQDESSAPPVETGIDGLYLHESIVWHPTYMVPAYYFQAVDSSGSPATLSQIISTDRFKRRTLLDSSLNITESVVQPKETDNAQFPLLSSGDHPILGISHWYFHPCETSPAIKELLDQAPIADWDSNNTDCLVRWLKAWFAVLSTAVDMN